MTKHVLICGASIAGPALAHWLHRYGFTVTVLERAPAPRPGGQAIDLRGTSRKAVERMGLTGAVSAACIDTRGMSVVNASNKRLASVSADLYRGDDLIAEIEILRGDLSSVLHKATRDDVEYIFGDHVTALHQDSDGVDVVLASGGQLRVDLVVGADGLRSGLRELVFGPESEHVTDLGVCSASFTVPNRLELDSWILAYCEPNRTAMIRGSHANSEATAMLSFAGTRADYDQGDTQGQQALLRSRLAGMRWEVPWLLDRMDEAQDFYFDSFSQVKLKSWSKGRVVLLGDSAFCSAPSSGQGTGLAVVGAYVLAGELAGSPDDHATAFTKYQKIMRGSVTAAQRMGRSGAKQHATSSWIGLWILLQAFRLMPYPPTNWLARYQMRKVVNAVDLPTYGPLELG
ncbi:FAD-dependent monooxygenase [Pseudonocardia spinosispora]|uniref:FAD-dependent monooxygenase n=1 Tax=Pseudonocardia spinosispora TaxID=103441 RepID=UPI0004036D8E|nr:FAD-dependent monooxygenase [Pseudonocardia spinosispora]